MRNWNVFHRFIDSKKYCKILPTARFIIAGKKCINKQLSKHVTSAFKLCYSQKNLYHKNKYYFNWIKIHQVVQNSSLPVKCINKIDKRKNAKQICICDFSWLYIKLLHDKPLGVLYKFVNFMWKGSTRDYIVINN